MFEVQLFLKEKNAFAEDNKKFDKVSFEHPTFVLRFLNIYTGFLLLTD